MRLGSVLRAWRLHKELGVREAGKMIGISISTLSRVERGYPPDGHTLAKILNWLMQEARDGR